MSKPWLNLFLMIAALTAPHAAWGGPETAQTPMIAENTAGAQELPGYFKTATRPRRVPGRPTDWNRRRLGWLGLKFRLERT
jgi:hypothetical protein